MGEIAAQMTQMAEWILGPGRMIFDWAGLERSVPQILALYVAILLTIIALAVLRSTDILRQRGVITTGRVVQIIQDTERPDRARIAFTAIDGEERRFTSSLACNDQTSDIGAEVDVIYDPEHPRRAQEAGRSMARNWYNATLVLATAGAYAFALAPVMPMALVTAS